VSQVVTLVRETAPDVDVQIAADDELVATVDPDQIRQAVMNLVKNACEALQTERSGDHDRDAPAKVEVRVELDGARGEQVRIVVTDNGPGMRPETKQRLFTPYFTTKSSGTGLGLAIVRRIVEEHDGQIQVDSELGVGTRFVVRLPLERRA
jgi:signal transduction histidine kinase